MVYDQEVARGAVSPTSVVLTTDAYFADALSASYLAKAHNSGILLTPPGFLSPETSRELLLQQPSTIYVLGGTAAISAAVITQINALYPAGSAPAITRIGGIDQFATNKMVNQSVPASTVGSINLTGAFANNTYNTAGGMTSNTGPANVAAGTAKTAIVASGTNYPDALAAAVLANKDHLPIILTSGVGSPSTVSQTTLPASAVSQLTSLGIQQVIAVGGPVALSNGDVAQIQGMGIPVLRIGGVDATDTARLLAQFEEAYAGFNGGGPVYVARGNYYTDALVSAPYLASASINQPLLLTEDTATAGPYLTSYLNSVGALSTGEAATTATGTTPGTFVQPFGTAGTTAASDSTNFEAVQFGGNVAITPPLQTAIQNAQAAGARP